YLLLNVSITLASFLACALYVRMLMSALQQLGNVINVVQRARASLERLNDLMRQKREIVELEDAKPLDPNDAAIELRNLSFSYEAAHNGELDKQGRLALNNLSLTIPQGTTLGIIGRTGSGKTTLMKLLLRLYDAPVNSIRYGRHDIRSIKLSSLRESIGYVPQDGFLFSTTIRDNIAFSDRSMDDKKVYEAAQHARIYDNIMDFPEQFDTKLGERGVTLSGGQRQRTSLARGMIKDAPILILDDSVSAVDAITETEILSN